MSQTVRVFPRTAAALLSAAVFLTAARPAATQQPAQAGAPAATRGTATRITTVEGITEYALPNGLHVLLIPDATKPTVTVNVTYLVGSRHEGYGETGMAHLLEHLMFKGSPRHRNIPQELTEHGSRPNGTTAYDRTNYFETAPATDANLDWALDLEADRMVHSFIAKKDLESEFTVVRNEFEMGENSPWAVTWERLMSTAYLWHGYGRSVVGTRSDIEHVPIERLQAFYRRYYQPDNAVLVVAGKFDPAKTLALVERKFGAIPKPARTQAAGNQLFATYTVEPTQDGERAVTVRRVGDAQLLMAGYHVPAGSHPDFAAVDVLSDVLGNNPSGRLYRALVDTKLAATVGVWGLQLREPGMLIAMVQLRTTQSVDTARDVMSRTLDSAATSTYSTEEVERAKTALLKNIDLALNSSETVGLYLSDWAAMGDWRLLFLHRDRIAKVTPADVQRVAAAYLKPSNRTVAMFLPTVKPDRAEIPGTPDVRGMVADYRGHEVLQAGEAFDPSPANIDARTQRSTLANGMHVTLVPKQTRGQRVVAQITLRFGAEQSLMARQMTATFLADLLSRGTTQLTRQQVSDSLDRLKAQTYIYGTANATTASIETTRENLVPVLDLIGQELRSPRFDAEEFDKLRREDLAGVEQMKSEPQVLANLALMDRLTPVPPDHPLHAMTMEEQIAGLGAMSLDSVKAFHKRFFGAASGDLVVAGDFDAAAVKGVAARLFGDWTSAEPFARLERHYAPTESTTVIIRTPDKENAALFAGQTLALRDDDPDYAAMALANFMIGGGFLNSRLATRIRQKEGLSYGIGSGLMVQSLDRSGSFMAYAIYAPQNVDRLVTAFREEIAKVRDAGFTAQEIEAAKAGYLQQRMQGRANDRELVSLLMNRRFAGRTLQYDEALDARIRALTPAEINAAVRKHLDLARMIMVRAGDFERRPQGGGGRF